MRLPFHEKPLSATKTSLWPGSDARRSGDEVLRKTCRSDGWWQWVICLALALFVWAVFGQTIRYGFLNYDDNEYVYNNPAIVQGLSLKGVVWAFTHSHGANWHPLTTLSHMLDCQLYGLNPSGHHLNNVLLHAAAAILLFLGLRNLTGALWRSAFVAAVFAIHPLRVESVAWVSERKDVLSGLFFLLTIGAYTRYAWRPFSFARYGVVLALFVLGLLSKPMLVTLPFVLLLLDYWPLGRVTSDKWRVTGPATRRAFSSRLKEKIPLLLLAIAFCVATILTQNKVIQSWHHLEFPARVGNALTAYAAYIGQMFYPAGLVVLYPHPGNQLPAGMVALSAVVLLMISAAVITGWRKRPYLLVGWLWYLGMLVPVIGLVQVGDQARADRYTYLPQIGLYVMAAWGAVDLFGRWRAGVVALRIVAVLVMASLLVTAKTQTTYWRDAVVLWSHTLACNPDNAVAHENLGAALETFGRVDEAIPHYERALQLEPDYAEPHNNLGVALAARGKLDEAISHYEQAIQARPDYFEAHNNLGTALVMQGRWSEAIPHYERALQIQPRLAEAHNNLGFALASQSRWDAAIPHYEQAVQIKPDFAMAHSNYGFALAKQGRMDEAIQHSQLALDIATMQSDSGLAEALRTRLKAYQTATPQRPAH